MIARIWGPIAVALACLVCIDQGRAQDTNVTKEIERVAASPKHVIQPHFGHPIPAPGPERGINVGPRQAVPPYSSFLGNETGSLSVDWVVPQNFIVGREADFELVLRNNGPVDVEQIEIVPTLPLGFEFVGSTPELAADAGKPAFHIAKLTPQQETRIRMRLNPLVVGDSRSQARVTFNTSSSSGFHVVEPKLKIAAEGPKSGIIGTQANFNVTVSNPGSGKAENVTLEVQLPEGLIRTADSSRYALGVLNPGETRTIRIMADVAKLGKLTSTFVATADNGLRDAIDKDVDGLGAQLNVEIDGPDFRYVTRPALYVVRVRNEGTTAAENTHVTCSVPKPFAFLSAERQGSFDAASKNINWFLGRLDVGEKAELSFRLQALAPGDFPISASAEAERGLSSEAQHVTRVAGIAAILLEVVDVEDPIEVGAETMYEILVTNQGTEFARGIRINAKVPVGMSIMDLTGPTPGRIDGQNVVFDAIPKLAPRADAVYRIAVRGTKSADFRIEVQATADTLDSPVTEIESTKVYQD